jgi:serine/threonine-protein kinase
LASDATRYQFLELLGRGGMGEVYRGRALGSHGFEKPVAIKRLREELARDQRFVDRLVQEAKLLVTLQHSNLVGVLDLGRRDDDVFIALEYVDGPHLGTLLATGALPLGIVTYIVRSACEGVAYAHQHPRGAVVHADLTPANILISRAGEVKVTDFGIARRESGAQRHAIEGKYPYMSPEQARGDALSPASDIFSMGVVLYEVMTGRRPFPGRDGSEIRQQILALDPPPPESLRPEVPPALAAVCTRALAKQPARRFDSIRAFAAAIRDVEFEANFRQGPAELAALVAERVPPRTTPSGAHAVLSELGIGAAADGRQTAVGPLDTTALLVGTVVERKPESEPGLSRWDVPAPPARAPRWPIALVAAAAIAGGALWLASRTVHPEQSARSVHPERSAGAAGAESKDAGAESKDAPPPDAAPGPDHPERSAGAAGAESKDLGTLRLHSEPWAYVTIDGRKTGDSTPSTHRLRAGTHRVRLHSPGTGRSRTLTVRIEPGKTTTVSVPLEPP